MELEDRGLKVFAEELRCLVVEQKVPLAEGALEDASAVTRRFAADLRATAAT